jgi:hypothetical protein
MNWISEVVASMRKDGCGDEEVAEFIACATQILNEIEWARTKAVR